MLRHTGAGAGFGQPAGVTGVSVVAWLLYQLVGSAWLSTSATT